MTSPKIKKLPKLALAPKLTEVSVEDTPDIKKDSENASCRRVGRGGHN